jgi:hypothetical protein
MKRTKGAKIEPMRKGKSGEKEYYSISIGLIPEWLLKAETEKGLWEHIMPDAELRKTFLARMQESELWKKGELFYGKNI